MMRIVERAGCPRAYAWGCLLVVSSLLAQSLLAEDAPHRLATRAQGETPLLSDLRELCDGIGGGAPAPAACPRPLAWAAKKFRDIGIQNVSVEPFAAQSMWLPDSAEAAAVAPVQFNIRIASSP